MICDVEFLLDAGLEDDAGGESFNLLQEDGDALLTEDGDNILTEDAP